MGGVARHGGKPDGSKNASPLPLPEVLVMMASVGNNSPAEPGGRLELGQEAATDPQLILLVQGMLV
jgi:hypothetical protein